MTRKFIMSLLLMFAFALAPLTAAAQSRFYNRGRPDYQPTYRDSYSGRDNYRGYRGDDYGDYDRHRHAGRSVAIVGGGAAAGAAVGAVTGGGKGAAIGALIGGVGGLIANEAVKHHHRD